MFMTIQEVAAYFGKHIETIRRWTDESLAGKNNFPLPITPPHKKRMWRKTDIENWDANGQERIETPTERAVRNAVIKNRLARHGLHIS